jgi:type I restriction enzyme S subunit
MKKGWQTRKLGDVLEVQNGYAFDSNAFNASEGMPLIRIRDLKVGLETETRFTGDYDEKYFVKAGDLLIGMDGEFGCYEWKGRPALLNQRVCRLQGFTSALVPRFLFYGVNSYLKAIEDVTGYATVKHLSSKQILSIEFPLPTLPEQQRIVGILDQAFEGIATAKSNIERNRQNARAIFESHRQSVFTQRGEGWVEKALGELASFRNGLNFTESSHGESVKIVGVSDFQRNFWAPLEGLETVRIGGALRDSDLLKENDLLFVRSNGNVKLIGRCLLVGEVIGKVAHSGFTIRARLTEGGVAAKYLCYFLKSKDVRQEMIDGGVGMNIKSLNQETLSALIVPLPSAIEQTRIATQLEAIDANTERLVTLYDRKLAQLEALKRSLLHQAFSGQL